MRTDIIGGGVIARLFLEHIARGECAKRCADAISRSIPLPRPTCSTFWAIPLRC